MSLLLARFASWGTPARSVTYVLRACPRVAIDRQLQTFADMSGVSRLGGKLRPDSLEPQQHFFADCVDETHLRQIYDQVRGNDGASDQRSSVLGKFSDEPAFQLHLYAFRKFIELHSQHLGLRLCWGLLSLR